MINSKGQTLHLERNFTVAQEKVFKAWSSSAAMSSWFGLGEGMETIATVDFAEGGHYTLVAGPYTVRGTYQNISPYDKIIFTWKWDHDPDVPVMLVTVTIEETSQGSKMTLIHDEIADLERLEQHKAGWEVALERFSSSLSTSS